MERWMMEIEEGEGRPLLRRKERQQRRKKPFGLTGWRVIKKWNVGGS